MLIKLQILLVFVVLFFISMEEFNKDLYQVYDMATKYLTGEDISPIIIISKASDVYIKYLEDVPEQLVDILIQCSLYINKDFGKEISFSEYITMGEELVEELSGILGEYFE